MRKFHKCPVWIDLGEGMVHWDAGEAEYTAHFDYSPGRPGKMYLRNGDPGYPDEPAELQINELERNGICLPIIDDDGDGMLTDEQYERIEYQVNNWIIEQEEAEQAEREDRP